MSFARMNTTVLVALVGTALLGCIGAEQAAEGSPVDASYDPSTDSPTDAAMKVPQADAGDEGVTGSGGELSAHPLDAAVMEPSDGAVVSGGCEPGAVEPCGVSDTGDCELGQRYCLQDRTWGECEGEVAPLQEQCDALGADEDCDGEHNEGCECTPGEQMPCGPSEVGACQLGQQVCDADGTWAACEGATAPIVEECGNQLDDDCDGLVDEGCGCEHGAQRACGDSEVGACQLGLQTCDDKGEWGTCEGAVFPLPEQCDTGGVDEDCDGVANEDCGCTPLSCEPGSRCESGACVVREFVAQYPVSGTAQDVSGFGHDGVLVGPTLTTDRFGVAGEAYLFDGQDDMIEVAHAPDLDLGAQFGQFTVEAWINPAEQKTQTIVVKGEAVNGTTAAPYGLGLSASGDIIASLRGSGGLVQARKAGYALNAWTHVAMTWDGATLRLFENAKEVASVPVSGPVNSNDLPVLIGTRLQLPANTFRGAIDSVQLAPRARSQAELCLDAALQGLPHCP